MSQQPEQWAQEALRILGEAERWVRRMAGGPSEDVGEPDEPGMEPGRETKAPPKTESVEAPAEAVPESRSTAETFEPVEDAWQEATDRVHIATGAPECELCPMCRMIRVMRRVRPDLAAQLVKVLEQVDREGRRIWR
jgi:hypothetical protein